MVALRIEGPAPSVVFRRDALLQELAAGGEMGTLGDGDTAGFWRDIGNVKPLAGLADRAVWRLSVAPSRGVEVAQNIARQIDAVWFLDWGGGLVWLAVVEPGDAPAPRRFARPLVGLRDMARDIAGDMAATRRRWCAGHRGCARRFACSNRSRGRSPRCRAGSRRVSTRAISSTPAAWSREYDLRPAPFPRHSREGGNPDQATERLPLDPRLRGGDETRCVRERAELRTDFTPAQLLDSDTQASEKILRACVHCGFCTATCPTYVLLGDELDSPRGRIYLIKNMLEADGPVPAETVTHIDRCLSCLACMTTCPSGVNYMHLVDHGRRHIEEHYRRPLVERALRRLLGEVLTRPARFRRRRCSGQRGWRGYSRRSYRSGCARCWR